MVRGESTFDRRSTHNRIQFDRNPASLLHPFERNLRQIKMESPMLSLIPLLLVLGLATASPPPARFTGTHRVTTYVYEGPKNLRGVNGYYLMNFEENRGDLVIEVTKTGYTKHDYPADKVLRGVARAKLVNGDATHDTMGGPQGARVLSFEVNLKDIKGQGVLMAFDLYMLDGQIYGNWEYHEKSHSRVVDGVRSWTTWGALRGQSGSSGDRVVLDTTTELPCPVCCDLQWRCGGQGPQSCNSSGACHESCFIDGQTFEVRTKMPMTACLATPRLPEEP